jgi:hypothetical protein
MADTPAKSYRGWQITLLALCLVCGALATWSFATDAIEASSALGFTVDRTSDPAFVKVVAIDSGGAAQTSGLREGDLIQLSDLSPGDRYRILTGVYPHEQIVLRVRRGEHTERVVYRAGPAPVWRWDTTLSTATCAWMLGFAMLLAWRRADSAEGRVLAVFFAAAVVSQALEAGSWLTPSPLADVFANAIGYTANWLTPALFAAYVAMFGRPLSNGRRIVTALTYGASAACALDEIVRLAAAWNGEIPWVGQTLGPDSNYLVGSIPYFAAVVALGVAMAATRGAERDRLVWSAAGIGLYLGVQGVGYFIPPLLGPAQFGSALIISYQIWNAASIIAPLGMTYALFNRRLLDIGFVINRVAVFSGVSIIVVVTFLLAEWAIGNWLHSANRTTNLILDAGAALAIGLSINYLHKRVEAFLDRVFFRKRHEDEEALRRFAREVGYMTDVDLVVERTKGVLQRCVGVSSVTVALADGMGRYGEVSENDLAVLALHASHRPVDLHRLATEFAGEFAYPMVAGGRLRGVLVLGPKRTGESFPPDESRAIEELAAAVGVAVETLSRNATRSEQDIRDALASIQTAIVDGFAALLARIDPADGTAGDDSRRRQSGSPGAGG